MQKNYPRFSTVVLLIAIITVVLVSGPPPLVVAQPKVDTQVDTTSGHVFPTTVVIDYYLYSSGSNQSIEYWNDYVLNLYEIVNGLYRDSGIAVYYRIDMVMIFQSEANNLAEITYNENNGEVSPNDLLTSFSDFVDTNSSFNGFEEVQLLSGKTFSSHVVGLAWTGDPSNPTKETSFYPRSIIQATYPLDVTGAISAHEIAHNFGAGHDGIDNSCNATKYLMSTTLTNQDHFSPCSINSLNNFYSLWFNEYIDNTIPIITDITDFDYEQDIGNYYTFTWIVSDDNPGYYNLTINGDPISIDYRINGSTIVYSLSLDVAGTYDFQLDVMDLVGHLTHDTFTFEIGGDLTPRINEQSSDLLMYSNETSIISWNVTDDGNSSKITLYRNDFIIETSNFTKSEIYNYTVTALDPGSYNFTLVVTDEIGQEAKSTIVVSVETVPVETSDTVVTTTSVSSTVVSSDTVVTRVLTQTIQHNDTTVSDGVINSILGQLPLFSWWVSVVSLFSLIIIRYQRKLQQY